MRVKSSIINRVGGMFARLWWGYFSNNGRTCTPQDIFSLKSKIMLRGLEELASALSMR